MPLCFVKVAMHSQLNSQGLGSLPSARGACKRSLIANSKPCIRRDTRACASVKPVHEADVVIIGAGKRPALHMACAEGWYNAQPGLHTSMTLLSLPFNHSTVLPSRRHHWSVDSQ